MLRLASLMCPIALALLACNASDCSAKDDAKPQTKPRRLPTVEQAMKLSPVMKDVELPEYSEADLAAFRMRHIETKKATGFAVVDGGGRAIRRYLDTNGDRRIDNWIYLADGDETYRDIDVDHDGIADKAVRTYELSKDASDRLVGAQDDASDRPEEGLTNASKKTPTGVTLEQLKHLRQARTATLGADHPAVKEVQELIEREEERTGNPLLSDPLRRLHSAGKDLTEDQLRQAVGILVERVLRLEEDVRELRAAPPRLELLR